MVTFGELWCGDMFNTKGGRWVKVDDNKAISVMASLFGIGESYQFQADRGVIVLYTGNPEIRKRLNSDSPRLPD